MFSQSKDPFHYIQKPGQYKLNQQEENISHTSIYNSELHLWGMGKVWED